MTKLERRIVIDPSWDKRDPNPKKNYGIHNCDISFYLIGEEGAFQFKALTGWYLPSLRPLVTNIGLTYPNGYDVGYHARIPQYEGQEPMTDNCQIIGGTCYYDGSGLEGSRVGEIMVEEGSEGVWKYLERRYAETFK